MKRSNNMRVIGLTGQVGSGKSTIAKKMEQELGAYLILTDDIAKRLMEPGQVSYNLVVGHFGSDILDEKNKINRKKLGGIVFHDKEQLKILNSFTHPYVAEVVQEEIDRVKMVNQATAIVIETALLFEAGYEYLCDEIWCVSISDPVRRARLKESRGYTEEKIDSILKNQMEEKELYNKCTKIIYNNGEIQEIMGHIQLMLVNKPHM